MERKIATILVADVIGYTRLMEAGEAGTATALKTLIEQRINSLIVEHHGRIVKLMGDGILAQFASVVDAVECAIEIQRAMPERNAEIAHDQRIQFRIGVHSGEVIVEGDNIYGDVVNLAARLEMLAQPGSINLSAEAYHEVKTKLGLAFEDLGLNEIKNMPAPIRVYRVLGHRSPMNDTSERHRVSPSQSIPPRINLAFATGGIGFLLALAVPGGLTGGHGFLIGLVIGIALQLIRAFTKGAHPDHEERISAQ